MSSLFSIIAIGCSIAAVLLLWTAWGRRANQRGPFVASLVAWGLALASWAKAFGMEVGIPLALESAAIVAFVFILSRIEFRDPALLGRAATNAYAAAKAAKLDHAIFLSAATPELPRMTALAIDAKGNHRDWNLDALGNILPRATARWTTFLREHHRTLHVPNPFGGWIVGLIGTALLASLFSGLLAHRRIIKDAFRLRWGGSKRLANADLHNRIGVGVPRRRDHQAPPLRSIGQLRLA